MRDALESDVLIIGSGPAGCTAGIYAARASLSVIIVSGNQSGGQLSTTTEVENYPGFALPVQGPWLMEQMQQQAVNVGCRFVNDHISQVEAPYSSPFILRGEGGNKYRARSIVVATGAQAKWLGLESEKKYQGYGVSGCATCDGFFFRDQDVIVIGGGNTAVEEALYLTRHAKKVYLLHRRDRLRAEAVLQERLFANAKVELIWNSVLDEVLGRDSPPEVTGVRVRSLIDGTFKEILVSGVFVAIGHTPNTALFSGILEMDSAGYIKTAGSDTSTSVSGIFACGDVQDPVYRQAVTAAGTGCMAALDAMKFLDCI
ncbi:thioredoxin-disulfide reductase [Neorickettsia risticii]|uniref:Thioredoxin reductase n=1 Tax=Neorickettsia risticii (strain Illinois) TaxID=434131 RepID=C6V545_NEORI|nr:thioredoxin-disulfide reductase [Neorickettsia risticii]ACT69510.1 thioredoxin-disulfide reductase [Neorickettsia risticii str. Illinois]